jgi:NAD(P)-dependent dehydrogenase (short-subunit alcohol dehydrogenase family)
MTNDNAPTHDLTGQTALVTGGSRGLGRAYAIALAKAGASVAVTARTESGLTETVRLIEEAGGKGIALPADVTEWSHVEAMARAAEERLGPIDLLINNAGAPPPQVAPWEGDPDEWWSTVSVNLKGPFLCARAVLPGMVARRRGRLINIVAEAGNKPEPSASAYSTSKAAFIHLTECLAQAVEEYGVKVLAYHPGLVRTTMVQTITSGPEGERFREYVSSALEQGRETPIEKSVEWFMLLATGQADALSGRYLVSREINAGVLERIDDILANDLHVLRVRR